MRGRLDQSRGPNPTPVSGRWNYSWFEESTLSQSSRRLAKARLTLLNFGLDMCSAIPRPRVEQSPLSSFISQKLLFLCSVVASTPLLRR